MSILGKTAARGACTPAWANVRCRDAWWARTEAHRDKAIL